MQNTRSIIVLVAVVALGLGATGVAAAATAAPEQANRGWSTPVGAADELDQRSD